MPGNMSSSEKRGVLRRHLESSRCLFPASVADPVSARIAEDIGFEIGMLAGSIASLAVLGAPDLIVLTQTELAAQARRICRAANLPLIVDADHGFGNALNVRRTVEELETAGVAALSIEDTLLPSAFGDSRSASLIPVQEGIGKMHAALDARTDPGLVIIGRTSAVSLTGVEDAIERATAYQDAGVDMLMLVGVKRREELEAVAAVAHVPLMLGGVPVGLMEPDYLAGLGVRVCLTGHQPFAASVKAIHDTLRALRDGVPPSELPDLAAPELMKAVMRDEDYGEQIARYLG